MPQATSARTTDRDRSKSRPSVTARGANAEHAPVLFRLPVIAMQLAADESPLREANQPAADSFNSAAVSLPFMPPPAGAAVPPPPVVNTATGTSATESLALQASVTGAASTTSRLQEMERPAPASVGHMSGSATATFTAPAVDRSWWEHWSSGVVLILLIIALVTASILALNDGGKATTEQLASEPVSAALDDFDLSNITIPDIAVSKPVTVGNVEQAEQIVTKSELAVTEAAPKNPTSHEVDVVAGNAAKASATAKLETAVAAQGATGDAMKKTNNEPQNKTQSEMNAGTTAAENNGAMAALAPPSNANLAAEPTKSPNNTTASKTGQAAGAVPPLASLALPVGVPPAPLFDAKRAGGVPSLTASTPAAPSATGASPQLYDGAGLGSDLHATRSDKRVATADASRSGAMVDTNLPSYATILASANLSENRSGQVVTTATPELDTQAIINAYLPYSQANQAQHGDATNRFAPAGGQPPATAQPTTPGGRGFMLGN